MCCIEWMVHKGVTYSNATSKRVYWAVNYTVHRFVPSYIRHSTPFCTELYTTQYTTQYWAIYDKVHQSVLSSTRHSTPLCTELYTTQYTTLYWAVHYTVHKSLLSYTRYSTPLCTELYTTQYTTLYWAIHDTVHHSVLSCTRHSTPISTLHLVFVLWFQELYNLLIHYPLIYLPGNGTISGWKHVGCCIRKSLH